jgi:hypothetical protein
LAFADPSRYGVCCSFGAETWKMNNSLVVQIKVQLSRRYRNAIEVEFELKDLGA